MGQQPPDEQPQWRRSRKCESGACTQVADGNGVILVRDSTAPGMILGFSPAAWHAFLNGTKKCLSGNLEEAA